MSAIFITTNNGERYYFDAVFSLDVSETGSPSEHPMADGAIVTDHYIHDPISISISGAVSKVKFLKNSAVSTDINEFVDSIRSLKRSSRFFTVGCGDILGLFPNCQFTSLQMIHNEATGQHSIDVSMSISQTTIAKAGQFVQTPTPAATFNDMLSPKSVGGSSGVEPPEATKMKLTPVQNQLADKGGFIRA